MNITDIFIKRPVLACVVSLMILMMGARAIFELPIRNFPKLESATVTVRTQYYGADPDVVAGFITTPLEAAISQAQGVDFLSSSSVSGASTITATLRLNYDANRALTEINTKINSVINQLPPQAQKPQITVATADSTAAMFVNFNSDSLSSSQLTDYLIRVVQPKLQTVPGVQRAALAAGDRQFAMRAWLDPAKLAAFGLTAADIDEALRSNNYIAALGATKGQAISIDLNSSTDLHTVEDFRNLVVKRQGVSLVRLSDVANVTLGAENYDTNGRLDGKKCVAIMIEAAPDANLLEVTQRVRAILPEIQAQLPLGVHGLIVHDTSSYVRSAINEVLKTLGEALLIVLVVVLLFMGSFRAALIPAVAIPLSLVGTFMIMLWLGYSINLLTLLALVLAIGLVVDDAIIIVENVDRHLKAGMSAMSAAVAGARELTGPIIVISIVLIAVYIPIGFMGGLTGALFTEFAFSLAAAVAISAVIALTLSPMMCSRFLSSSHAPNRLSVRLEGYLGSTTRFYQALLRKALDAWPVLAVFGVLIVLLILVFAMLSKKELAPQEDQGFVVSLTTGPPTTTMQQMGQYSRQVYNTISEVPELNHAVQFDGFGAINRGFSLMILKPWSERERTTTEIVDSLKDGFTSVAGAKVAIFSPPSLPGGGNGLPIQFVIKTTDSLFNLNEVAQSFVEKAQQSGKFYYLDNSLKYHKPQTTVVIDRDKAATMGLSMKDVGDALSSMLGGGYVNYFSMDGRSYKVIPQVQQKDRLNADQLQDYYIRTPEGSSIPASTLISLKTTTVPETINHFQQLNSATIGAVAGVPMGEALKVMQDIAKEVLPAGYDIDYGGQSRQSIQETNAFSIALAFSVVIIFLVLAAQFESFRDPLIVMTSVPMAIFGAMVFIFLGVATMNIYTEVGLITLMALITKHGILIVQYANEEQKRGRTKRAAIEIASLTRLRPILMTSVAMVLGVIPLVISGGPGAASRNHMGVVIASGVSIGTLFTLFIVPAIYLALAKEHKKSSVKEPRMALKSKLALEAAEID